MKRNKKRKALIQERCRYRQGDCDVDIVYGIDNYITRGVYYIVLSEDCGYLRFFPLSGVSRAHLGNRISLRNHNQLILRKEGVNMNNMLPDIFFLTY